MSAPSRKEQARSRSVRVGVATLVGAAAITGFALTAQNGTPDYVPGVSRTTVDVAFEDVGALRPGDDVRIANVRAGFVDSIDLVDGVPVAVLKLDDGRKVYSDASASIGSRSALGQKYVELAPGTAASGPLSGTITTQNTRGTVELDTVLDTFDERTRASTRSTLREVGGGLTGRSEDLQAGLDTLDENLDDLAVVAEALSTDGGADLTQLLRAGDVLASSLTDQREELASMTTNLAGTLEAFDTEDGVPLAEFIKEVPSAMKEVREALVALDGPLADTEQAVTALRPGAVALGEAMPDTRGFLREAVKPMRTFPKVGRQAETAVESLTPLLADARPVVGQLGTLFDRGQAPLTTLAPYAPEAMLFFRNAASALGQTDQTGGWLRFYPVVNAENIIGNLPIRNPLLKREAYPAPGRAPLHRTSSLEVLR